MPEEGRDQEIYEAETKYEIMISTMSCFWDKNQNREIILEVSVLNGDVVVLRFLLFSLLLSWDLRVRFLLPLDRGGGKTYK